VSELKDPDVFRSILEGLQTGVYVVNRNQKVLFWNAGAERITGYLRQDVLGRSWQENVAAADKGGDQAPADPAHAIQAALRDGTIAVAQVSVKHRDGHRIPLRMHTVPVRDTNGAIIGVAHSFEEPVSVSEWDARQTKLAAVGCLDSVTGALNQSFILFHLRESIATFVEHQVPFSIARILVDRLDHFRHQCGPGAVSAILRAVAQTLESSLRPTDFLGHLDDDQFLAILTECTASEIDKVTERLQKMVTYAEIRWWGDEISVTASFGGTSVKPGDTSESMLERSQKLLDQSVQSGGNAVTVSVE
jgi:PAS domain S-box-containing protein/diguanylate cyclase (GGDEF)-like protein